MEKIRNFKCEFNDIIGLVTDENKKYSRKEFEEIVKKEVIYKIKTIGVEEWIDSFLLDNSIKEVK